MLGPALPSQILSAGGGGGGGGLGFPNHDWAADFAGFGDGSGFPDLNAGDGLAAAANLGTIGGGAGLRFSTNGTTTLVGRYLSDLPAGDWAAAVRLRTTVLGANTLTSMYAGAFMSVFLGTDRTVDTHRSIGFLQKNHDTDSGGLGYITGGTRATALTSSSTSNTAGLFAPRLGQAATFYMEFTGTTLNAYVSSPDGGGVLLQQWAGLNAATAKQLVVMAAVNNAGHTIVTDVLAFKVASAMPFPAAD